jgi:1-deoxy-D-xylulose-5-phosphate reductoisomerase
MRLPIMKALGFPESLPCDWGALDLARTGALTFAEPDEGRFPCLRLAYQAIEGEESLPVVLNAANEVAVEAFCARRIPYLSIPEVITRCLDTHSPQPIQRIEDALEVHAWARNAAQRMIEGD